MTCNVGHIDQCLRIVIGLAFFAGMVEDGAITPAWPVPVLLGLILIITALFSCCPLYTVLGVTTCKNSDRTA